MGPRTIFQAQTLFLRWNCSGEHDVVVYWFYWYLMESEVIVIITVRVTLGLPLVWRKWGRSL